MYTTPTRALERLTNIKPLELHLKQKAATTVARIFSSVNKSNWDGIGSASRRGHLFQWTKYLGPSLPPITRAYGYNFKTQDTKIGDGRCSLTGLKIFTDGSKTTDGVGSGWIAYHDGGIITRGCRRLPKHCTVYEAEMLAVMFALDDLDMCTKFSTLPDKMDVMIDNQATIKTFRSLKLVGEVKLLVVDRIDKFSRDRNCLITFEWVKGHTNNEGNDSADLLAKKGCTEGEFYYIKPSLSYIKSIVKTRVLTEWNQKWANLPNCRQSRELITFNPDNKNQTYLFSRGRQGCRKIVSLLTGHNNLKYHVFRRLVSNRPNTSPVCRFCETDIETSWHLLYDCPRYDTRRREFIFSPDNPKTGPDIAWYHNLACHLGILDLLMDREYLDGLDLDLDD